MICRENDAQPSLHYFLISKSCLHSAEEEYLDA
jgi:hypothetical protein